MILTFPFYISSTKASSLLCTYSKNWNTKSNLEMVWLALVWKLHKLQMFNWGLNKKGDKIHQVHMINYWLNFLHRILDDFDMNINQMGQISKVWSFANYYFIVGDPSICYSLCWPSNITNKHAICVTNTHHLQYWSFQ
jgi:hypothetical protein